MVETTAPELSQLSPDGQWRWDGLQWQRIAAAPDGHEQARSRRSWPSILGGITALVSVPVVLGGCILPFVNWKDTSAGTSAAILNPGFGGGYFFAVEPAAVIVLTIPAAIVLIAAKRPLARAVAAGALIAFGLQTIAMFVGYTFGDLGFGRIGPGGPVGLLGGAVLFAGGAFGMGSLFIRD